MSNNDGAIESGSANVFVDIGLPDPVECLAKAQLAMLIADLLRARGLTQVTAARLLNTTQPRVSDLLAGHLSGLGIQRLLRFLLALGQDVEIVVRPARSTPGAPTVRVVSGRAK